MLSPLFREPEMGGIEPKRDIPRPSFGIGANAAVSVLHSVPKKLLFAVETAYLKSLILMHASGADFVNCTVRILP